MDSIDDVGIVAKVHTASTVVGEKLFWFGFLYSIQREVLIDTKSTSTIPPENRRTKVVVSS